MTEHLDGFIKLLALSLKENGVEVVSPETEARSLGPILNKDERIHQLHIDAEADFPLEARAANMLAKHIAGRSRKIKCLTLWMPPIPGKGVYQGDMASHDNIVLRELFYEEKVFRANSPVTLKLRRVDILFAEAA